MTARFDENGHVRMQSPMRRPELVPLRIVRGVAHDHDVGLRGERTRFASCHREGGNVGSVLVVDGAGYLSGIVTDRDVTTRGMAEGRTVDSAVEHVMTRDVATIGLHADASDAASVMSKRMVRRLPVVDEENRPHGVLTFDDMVRHLGSETDALADLVILQATRLAGV